jgi:ABC-2 type transport system ATP-binding protein
MAEVERLCTEVLMLKRGRIVDRGSPDDLLRRYGRDDLEAVFLDIARDRRQSSAPVRAAV